MFDNQCFTISIIYKNLKMLINNLPLPPLLLELIAQNRWRVSENAKIKDWEKVFFKDYISLKEITFFDLETMEKATNYLVNNSEKFKTEFISLKNITQEHTVFPKTIIPEKAIVIMDKDGHWQSEFPITPICLDYRISLDNPSVIYYPDAWESFWDEVSPTFEQFVKDLKL